MKNFLLLCIFLFSTSSMAMIPKKTFKVSMDLVSNEKVISNPKMIIKEGRIATAISGPKTKRTYFEILANQKNPLNENEILLELRVGYINDNGTKSVIAKPKLTATSGKETLLTIIDPNNNEDLTLRIFTEKNY